MYNFHNYARYIDHHSYCIRILPSNYAQLITTNTFCTLGSDGVKMVVWKMCNFTLIMFSCVHLKSDYNLPKVMWFGPGVNMTISSTTSRPYQIRPYEDHIKSVQGSWLIISHPKLHNLVCANCLSLSSWSLHNPSLSQNSWWTTLKAQHQMAFRLVTVE